MIEVTRRSFVAGVVATLGAGLAAARPGAAQPASAGPPAPQLIEDLVAANRILVDQGVLDGYGHVSARHDRDPGRFLMSRSIAPELVTAADVLRWLADGAAASGAGCACAAVPSTANAASTIKRSNRIDSPSNDPPMLRRAAAPQERARRGVRIH